MRIGLDAMGGDRAPGIVVQGALKARELLQSEDRLVLVGREAMIREQLKDAEGWEQFIDIHHAEQTVGMDDPPVETLRARPDSSIAVLAELHARGEVQACISAGNTGAFVAAAQMRLRRLRGVHRPGIAILTPTPMGPVALCDVGANVNARPQHLRQYGLMASVYLRELLGIREPRVGLLSIGEEDAKGTELVKEARALMREDKSQHFVGNVEGRDLFSGVCDVMICEGFVGNVVLKLIEGMADRVLMVLLKELAAALPDNVDRIREFGRNLQGRYDFNEYGGAPLLGVGGTCIICHGASDWRGIKNAVRAARGFVAKHVNEQIVELLSQDERAVHA